MMVIQKKIYLVALAAIALYGGAGFVDCSADIIKQIYKGFASPFGECRKEMNIQDGVMKEVLNFWIRDDALVSREVGCVIICMAKKHNLLGTDGKLQTEIAQEFFKEHEADDAMTKKLIEILRGCVKTITDDCARVLELDKCFRDKVKESGWSPNFQEIIEELIAEGRV